VSSLNSTVVVIITTVARVLPGVDIALARVEGSWRGRKGI
jgi:hypothetical protein